jgi:hypothetical protein
MCRKTFFSKNKYLVLVSVHMLSGLYIALTCVEKRCFTKNKHLVLLSVHMLSGLYIVLTCVEKRFLVKINI